MGKHSTKWWDNYEFLNQKYSEESLSTQAIAREVNTYPNTIRRALKRHGISLRGKSDAQRNYLDKYSHPMEGRARPPEERHKISEGAQKKWEGMTPEQAAQRRAEMAERAQLKWDWMSEKEKKEMIDKMHRANRERSGMGSKNENLVAKGLSQNGYDIVQRTTHYTPRHKFEIDIAIPDLSVAIEWDGVAHFAPIYGDKNLQRTIQRDERKNKALLSAGWTVIRCRDHSTSHSMAFCRRAIQKILDVIRNGKKNTIHFIDVE